MVLRLPAQLESSGHPGLPVHVMMFYRNFVITPSTKTKGAAEETILSAVDTSNEQNAYFYRQVLTSCALRN